MDLLHRVEYWGDRHHPRWMDIVRIALGVFLIIKGIQFPEQMSMLLSKIPALSGNDFLLVLVGHYIPFAHILGGILMICGVLTRFASLIQLPILIGAIVFINSYGNLWKPFSELYVSILVFLLLVYFLIAGNGEWSLARYMQEKKR